MTWREFRQSVAEAAVGLAGIGVAAGDVVAMMASN
jgi:long-subunit acyl-CoA synthetase (AMP-forming)